MKRRGMKRMKMRRMKRRGIKRMEMRRMKMRRMKRKMMKRRMIGFRSPRRKKLAESEEFDSLELESGFEPDCGGRGACK